jgi:plastocyanin
MKTNILVGIFVIGLLTFGTYVAHSCPDLSAQGNQSGLIQPSTDNVIVLIRDKTMMPDVVTVKSGTTVTWINNDKIDHIVASNPYLQNTDLPELLSQTIKPGESYSFTFTKSGQWGYHSALNKDTKGRVVVVE